MNDGDIFPSKCTSHWLVWCDSLEIHHLLWLHSSLRERSVFSEHLLAPLSSGGQRLSISDTAHIPGVGADSLSCSKTLQSVGKSLPFKLLPPKSLCRASAQTCNFYIFNIFCALKTYPLKFGEISSHVHVRDDSSEHGDKHENRTEEWK